MLLHMTSAADSTLVTSEKCYSIFVFQPSQYIYSHTRRANSKNKRNRFRNSDVYIYIYINPLNVELNPIRHLLALVGARHIVHFSRVRVNTFVVFLITLFLTRQQACCYSKLSLIDITGQRAMILKLETKSDEEEIK